jgi:AhpD family alkylhydroperoxidase
MIAVAVSSENRCYYCLVAHGAAVRGLSDDPVLGELMVMNYRAARLDRRQRAMLDFAVKLTAQPFAIEEADRETVRKAAFPTATLGHRGGGRILQHVQPGRGGDGHAPNSIYHGQRQARAIRSPDEAQRNRMPVRIRCAAYGLRS